MNRIDFFSFQKTFAVLMVASLLSLGAKAQLRPVWSANVAFEANGMLFSDGADHTVPLRPGFAVGGFATQAIGKHFAIRAGLGYAFANVRHTWRGLILSSDIDPQQGVVATSTLDETSSFHSIQVPMLFEFHFNSLKKGFFAGLGPVPNYILGCKRHLHIVSSNGNIEDDYVYGTHQRINVAIQGDLGYRLPLNELHALGIEMYGNYNLGMYDLLPSRMANLGLRLSYNF